MGIIEVNLRRDKWRLIYFIGLGVVLTKFYFSRVAGQLWKIFENYGRKGFNEVFPVLTGQGNNFEMPHAARIL